MEKIEDKTNIFVSTISFRIESSQEVTHEAILLGEDSAGHV